MSKLTKKILTDTGLNRLVTQINTKFAPLNSPELTGAPTAPTPTAGDDSTKIATTEFVQDAIDSSGAVVNAISDSTIANAWNNIDPTSDAPGISYSGMTAAQAAAGTSTANMLISPKVLADYVASQSDSGTVQAITTGTTNGTISVDGTEVSVAGLGTAAYTSASDYALVADIPTIPTNVSSFTNDASYATENYVDTAVAGIVIPTVPTKVSDLTNDSSFATETYVDTAVAGVTVPTKVSDLTNDSNFATESYVGTAIANLVNSAPATLDTLDELAAALGDDPNFATTIATNIGSKVSATSANYIKAAAVSNNTLTLTKGDDTTVTFTDTNTTYDSMTAAQATTGTSTDAVLISPKVLADYVTSLLTSYLSTSGGTVNGNLTIGNNGHIILPSGVELY